MTDVLGSTVPRLWTRPLRPLMPDTSYGFAVVDFARDVLGTPLDPWQEWVVIHAGELLADGRRPRFRQVLILCSRQNGKTLLLSVLALFWLFVEKRRMVLGLSTNLAYAKEAWQGAITMAEESLSDAVAGVRLAAGEESLNTVDGCRYRIAAANRRGGRSLTVDRLIVDEVREHHAWPALHAALPTMRAVPDAQAFLITNQGDDQSVVLDSYRKSALGYIETGDGDERLGLFEWSAEDGADPEDVDALAQANPNIAHRLDWESLLADARRAKAAGGEELAGFRTEAMCQRVHQVDPAIDPDRWDACADPGDLTAVRDRVALAVDVALDGLHATMVAAAVLPDGRVRVETVAAWSGVGCTDALRRELPGHVERVKPKVFGWFPSGPAASVAADLTGRDGRTAWPPPGVRVEEIRVVIAAVCMGFADLVRSRLIAHSDDPLLTAHVQSAQKLRMGDAWRYTRRGAGQVDGAYALAGAVHLARTLPAPRGKLVVL